MGEESAPHHNTATYWVATTSRLEGANSREGRLYPLHIRSVRRSLL